ncbi:hypothetical protein BH09BAC1_BH09BAC1_27590 [soil metagenome]
MRIYLLQVVSLFCVYTTALQAQENDAINTFQGQDIEAMKATENIDFVAATTTETSAFEASKPLNSPDKEGNTKIGFFETPNSPYKMDWRAEAFIIPAGIGVMTASMFLDKTKGVCLPGSYNMDHMIGINRRSVRPINERPAKISDGFFFGSVAAPSLLLFDKDIRRDKSFYMMWAEVMLINSSLTMMAKSAADHPRPYVYNSSENDNAKMEGKDPLRSFFSGHTSMTAASTFFMAKVWTDYHPHSKWRFAVWGAAAATPAVTGYLRVRAGMHFPTDVALGYVVGAATGYLVPLVHQKLQQRKEREHPHKMEAF